MDKPAIVLHDFFIICTCNFLVHENKTPRNLARARYFPLAKKTKEQILLVIIKGRRDEAYLRGYRITG